MAVQVVGQAGAPAKHLVLWLNVVGLLSAVRAQCSSANCNGCSTQARAPAGCELGWAPGPSLLRRAAARDAEQLTFRALQLSAHLG